MPKVMSTFRPNRRRRLGRLLKRLSDEAEEGIARSNIVTDGGDDDYYYDDHEDEDDDDVNKKVRGGVGIFTNVCPKTTVLVKIGQSYRELRQIHYVDTVENCKKYPATRQQCKGKPFLRLSGYTQWFYIVDTLKVGQQHKRNAFLRFNHNNDYANAPRTLPILLFRIFVTKVDFEFKVVSITVTSKLVQYSKSQRFNHNWR